MKKKYRENMAIKDLDDIVIFMKHFCENITYGEMREIANDKRKLNIIENLHKEFVRVLNDIDILSKERKKEKKSK